MMYVVSACAWGLVFGFCYPQYYETRETSLTIRAGLRTTRIPYDRITAVRPATDSRSAVAMSLHRVLVEYDGGEVLIAPANQDLFLDDILRRAPQLSRSGQAFNSLNR
jgi:hypothetical protein